MMLRRILMAMLVLSLTSGVVACKDEGPMEQAGEKLDEAMDEVEEAKEDAKETME